MAIQGCAAKLPTRSKTRSGQLETDCRNLRRTVSHIPSARRSTSAELHHICIWTVDRIWASQRSKQFVANVIQQRYNVEATSHKKTTKVINHSAPILTRTPA
ncbi:hypothetical protein QWA68_002634 [Fusarium oxysporum]|nr:hypothetical protein QWA68_002634 [Fusarium oxysporum]